MISREDVFQIGQIQRPHGLQGELSFSFSSDIFDEVDVPCFICELDGILVPFFIEEYRFKNNDIALVKFEGIDNEEEAKTLVNAPLFIEKKYLSEEVEGNEIEGVSYYVGFMVYDGDNLLGEIIDYDDETENVLFLISNEKEEEFIVPACDEYIVDIDNQKKILRMELPEGLLSMNTEQN